MLREEMVENERKEKETERDREGQPNLTALMEDRLPPPPPCPAAYRQADWTGLFHSLVFVGLRILHVVGGVVCRMKAHAVMTASIRGVVPCPRGANAQLWKLCVL